jgi:filamentous hemagglutinin
VAVTGLGAAAAGASSAAGATSNVAESFNTAGTAASNTPLAEAALSYLEVFVTGLGEGNCRPDDVECLKRERLDQAAH